VSSANEKLIQYLDEARATEEALVRTLQSHIAITPRGDYRKLLERHLRETERHRDQVERRLRELGESRGAVETGVGTLQSIAGQVLAMGKAPLDAARGETGEEKLVKNAKDEAASEALEIATYRALEALARHVGDEKTAELAAKIRADEERMLADLQELIPSLTEAAAAAEVTRPSYDAATTGAADAAREAAARGRSTVEVTRQRVLDAARDAMDRVTRATRDAIDQIVEAAGRGEDAVEATTSAAMEGVEQTAREAERAVRDTVQAARRGAGETVEEAERQAGRTRRTARTQTPPWAGYDKQGVSEITKRLAGADEDLAKRVREYEQSNKKRKTVIERAKQKA
jgi:ferritin-like metal-binding protein YciE